MCDEFGPVSSGSSSQQLAALDAQINGVAASGTFTVSAVPGELELWDAFGFFANGPTFTFVNEVVDDYQLLRDFEDVDDFINDLLTTLNDVDGSLAYMTEEELDALRGVTWVNNGDGTFTGTVDEKGALGNEFVMTDATDGSITGPSPGATFTGGVDGLAQTKLAKRSRNISIDFALEINESNYLRYIGANLVYENAWGLSFDASLEDTDFNCTIANRSTGLIGVSTSLTMVPSIEDGNAVEQSDGSLVKTAAVNVVGDELHFFGNVVAD